MKARAYCRIDQPLAALEVCNGGLEKLPNDISLLKQQGRIQELIGNFLASVKIYKQIIQLDAMNTEALSCIAVHYFYNYQPEMALMYYRRVLSMGLNACELYCNIGLCCLYGGQLDLGMKMDLSSVLSLIFDEFCFKLKMSHFSFCHSSFGHFKVHPII